MDRGAPVRGPVHIDRSSPSSPLGSYRIRTIDISPQPIPTSRPALAGLVVLCVLLASVSLVCGIHEHSDTHCCDLCHFGFLPWVQAEPPPSTLPLVAGEWQPRFSPTDRIVDETSVASRGRAPPAC